MTNSQKKKLTKKTSTSKLNCSPTRKLKYTCYVPTSLHKMKTAWNSYYPNNKIKTNDTFAIWKFIKENLKDKCSNEKCWMFQPFMSKNLDKQLTTFTFAPPSPREWKKDPYTWLTNFDIERVLKQYEYTYPKFKLIGASSIDFDTKIKDRCVYEELCKFQLTDFIKKNITKIGIVLNTDPHYLTGSHWICIFINIPLKYIYFFDSNGTKAPNQVVTFINRVSEQSNAIGTPFKIIYNTIPHQKTNTECGMYVLYIIITLLKRETYPNFKAIIPDSKVASLRKVLFNEVN